MCYLLLSSVQLPIFCARTESLILLIQFLAVHGGEELALGAVKAVNSMQPPPLQSNLSTDPRRGFSRRGIPSRRHQEPSHQPLPEPPPASIPVGSQASSRNQPRTRPWLDGFRGRHKPEHPARGSGSASASPPGFRWRRSGRSEPE